MSSGFFSNVPSNIGNPSSPPSRTAASNWDFSVLFNSSAQPTPAVNNRPLSPIQNSPGDDPFYLDDPFEPPLFVPESSNTQQRRRPLSNTQSPSQQTPPPSNQLARHNPVGIADLLNSDPFDDFINENAVAPASSPPLDAIDLTDGVVDLTTSPNMAPAKKRKRATDSQNPVKRPTRRSSVAIVGEAEHVDLAGIEDEEDYAALKLKEKAEELKKQQLEEATRPVRLAEIQCIICMDNPKDLTVTHCGHMFCSECLHEALYAGNNEKKSCPVCRTVIGTTLQGRGADKKQPKNGVFHLEMKLMTSNRKGKMPQRNV
ncbi:Slx8 protein [Phlyctema vagabunda]|uniref:Slx8 protein n=1 Tax=Phlyctema vagabunda TaxID=108571 RepID=A0ABR4PIR4_9HELO